jgi:hypothetical protein
MALTPQRERYPTLEIVQKVVHSMPVNSDLDLAIMGGGVFQ